MRVSFFSFGAASIVCGIAASSSNGAVDYARDIQPIFATNCYKCHGPEKQKSGLRLDRRAGAFAGGDSGEKVIVPVHPDASYLIRLVSGAEKDKVMPPKGERLSTAQIASLREWIAQGAEWPKEAEGQVAKNHWSFQPARRIEPPKVEDHGWCTNEIDKFIFAGLARASLQPSSTVDRAAYLRRVYLVMHGLAPTESEINEFVQDRSPDAYEKAVDRALASPHYGERWASDWLDLVHFAETTGFETNTPRSNAWPYRDYVIDAFNTDKPYTDFILDQLAGDARGADAATGFLVAGPDDAVKSPDIVLTTMQRHEEVRDIVNTTTTSLLGLTVACAPCHNHKFDPITQRDFYAFKAVFAGVKHGERPLRTPRDEQRREKADEVRQRISAVQTALEGYEPITSPSNPRPTKQRDPVNAARNIDRFTPTEARFVRFTALASSTLEPCIDELEICTAGPNPHNVALAKDGAVATASSEYPNNPIHKIPHVNDGLYGNEHSWISNEQGTGWIQIDLPRTHLIDRVIWGRDRNRKYTDRVPTRYRIEVAKEPGAWRVVADSDDRFPFGARAPAQTSSGSEDPAVAKLRAELRSLETQLARLAPMNAYAGTFAQPGPVKRLYRGDPLSEKEEVPPGAIESIGPPLLMTSNALEAGRRLRLAKWIASEENPLTARVMVNRIWQHLFGEGLVSTPSDFGKMGSSPSNPELLDYLASQFMQQGWSVKRLTRSILLSSTFRQSSRPRAEGLKIDAGNRLLWRFAPRRLEAESIHDRVLQVTGKLDLTMGGPGYSGFLPNDNYVRVYNPKERFVPEDWRRMIYQTKVRMVTDPTFGPFDCPDAGQVAPKRARSTTAIQALSLFNSHFMIEQAGYFSERLKKEAGDEVTAQTRLAFKLTSGRDPDERELAASVAFIKDKSLPLFCRAMLNANEFVFVQ